MNWEQIDKVLRQHRAGIIEGTYPHSMARAIALATLDDLRAALDYEESLVPKPEPVKRAFHAYCETCGWQGYPRDAWPHADSDGSEHTVAMAIGSEPIHRTQVRGGRGE